MAWVSVSPAARVFQTFRIVSGGSSPTPQSWPPGLREMQVDGSKGKTYRVDVTGDSAREATFTLNVSYHIACER